MEAKDYISSGILEQYVLGLLSEEEMQEVDQMAHKHPEVREELDAIRNSMSAYATANDVKPAPGTLEGIMDSISDSGGKTSKSTSDTVKSRSLYGRLVAAASIVLLLSLGLNVYLFLQMDDLHEQIARLREENTVLAEQVEQVSNEKAEAESLLAFISDATTRQISMPAVDESLNVDACVFWNKESGHVVINASRLPQAPTGKQYQLWALKDGEPKSAGLVALGSNRLQRMQQVDAADAFAVTLEPEGGSDQPTLEELKVMGKVNKS